MASRNLKKVKRHMLSTERLFDAQFENRWPVNYEKAKKQLERKNG